MIVDIMGVITAFLDMIRIHLLSSKFYPIWKKTLTSREITYLRWHSFKVRQAPFRGVGIVGSARRNIALPGIDKSLYKTIIELPGINTHASIAPDKERGDEKRRWWPLS